VKHFFRVAPVAFVIALVVPAMNPNVAAASPVDQQRDKVENIVDELERLEEQANQIGEDYVAAIDRKAALDDEIVDLEGDIGVKETELAELRAEGLIRWVGISNVTRKHVAIARAIVPIQTVQNILSPFHRGALRRRLLRKSFVAHSAGLGLGFLAHSPLGGSRLNHRLATDPVLRSIAEQRGRSPHAIALAWVRAQGPQVIPIPGARTVERALDSVSSIQIDLNPAEVAAIDHARMSAAG